MFCQNCGTQIQPGQQFCGKCAMPLTGYGVPPIARLERHVHLLGIFWIAYSALYLLAGSVMFILANTLFGHMGRVDSEVPIFIRPVLSVVAMFLLGKSILGVAAGYGLLQHLDWARILAIILGFIALLNFPFGTALGVYTIWALLAHGADREYRALPKVAAS